MQQCLSETGKKELYYKLHFYHILFLFKYHTLHTILALPEIHCSITHSTNITYNPDIGFLFTIYTILIITIPIATN